jgi:sulfur relay (sulfurtransferase) complex TusBCD TusD component (DsrE family)
MHYAISATWGPTDTTRASLPFIFAASALQYQKMVPFGPPPRFEEVFSNTNAEIIVCKPCAEARGISANMLLANCKIGGMNDYYAHVSRTDCKAISF